MPSIAGYRALRCLGVGGMSVVYEAVDAGGRTVALKLMRPERLASQVEQQRLLREARALAALSHPNIVALFDTGTCDGQVFIAMECVPGSSLATWLTTPRGWREKVEMFVQAGRGLAAAHAAGLVHRDVKPANVMIGDDGRARVVDFGLVRALAGATDVSAASAHFPAHASIFDESLTKPGTIVGTPAFMAPEQIEGRRGGPRSDQFSFCVALYCALYGQRPFAGVHWHDLVGNVLAGHVLAPAAGEAPDWLFAAIRRGLSVQPRARWPSMDALVDALDRGLRGEPGPPEPPASSKRAPLLAVAVFVLALALMTIALLAVL